MEKTDAKPGDYVLIELMKQEYKGILLEAPRDEKGIILLKLDSGYNIGLIRKDILSINILDKKKQEQISEIELSKNKEKPNIAMIITGGTIAARLDSRTGAVSWLTSPNQLFKYYPKLFEKVNISRIEVPFMKASEDMDCKDWKKIAKTAVELLNDDNIKGLIITHGTDFLHYTSAALSFFLRDLNKPVVLTYSQRSIDRASSDANLNLQCSALAAISDIAEVILVGHASESDDYCYAMPGTKVRKLHTSRRDAFKTINAKPLAKIYANENKIERVSEYLLRHKGKIKLDDKFEEKIALIKFYPGQSPDILDYYLKNGYKGLIIEMSGLGHVSTMASRNGWTKKLKEIIDRGMVVCAVTQCINGRVDPLVYSNGREILSTGVVYLEDMLAETAFVKLGYVLGKTKDKEEIKRLMLKNIAREFNKRLEE